jgi:hypothetical protein
VRHYEQYTAKDKNNGILDTCNQLIVCVNSLHYLSRTFGVLVIDEIETLIDKFQGTFMQKKHEVWQTFLKIVRQTPKVILLDAFITTKTLNFFKEVEASASMIIYKRIHEPSTRTVKNIGDLETTLNHAIKAIASGKKCFIFYPYKKYIGGVCPRPAMEQLYETICERTGKTGVFYNAEVGDATKKKLRDVNAAWQKLDFVITNNIITCGVNYDQQDFDSAYLFYMSKNAPRDIIQVSYRCRTLISNTIYACYLGGKPNVIWDNDCKTMDCPIYTNLYDSIMKEKKAPIVESFQLFCVKAHYKQVEDIIKLEKEIKTELNESMYAHQCGYRYEDVEVISDQDAQDLQQLCFMKMSSTYDKVKMQRYYLDKRFVNEAKKTDEMSNVWENNDIGFFEKTRECWLKPDNIFVKIADENDYQGLFPPSDSPISSVKLSAELRSEIFNEYSFKYLTTKSNARKIVSEVYNLAFKQTVIDVKTDKNKNATYSLSSSIMPYYNFANKSMYVHKDKLQTWSLLEGKKAYLEQIIQAYSVLSSP